MRVAENNWELQLKSRQLRTSPLNLSDFQTCYSYSELLSVQNHISSSHLLYHWYSESSWASAFINVPPTGSSHLWPQQSWMGCVAHQSEASSCHCCYFPSSTSQSCRWDRPKQKDANCSSGSAYLGNTPSTIVVRVHRLRSPCTEWCYLSKVSLESWSPEGIAPEISYLLPASPWLRNSPNAHCLDTPVMIDWVREISKVNLHSQTCDRCQPGQSVY